MKKINFYDVICLLILRGKNLSIYYLITIYDNAPPLSREYSRNMLMNDHHEKRSGSGQNEKEPEVITKKKKRKWSTRKKNRK